MEEPPCTCTYLIELDHEERIESPTCPWHYYMPDPKEEPPC